MVQDDDEWHGFSDEASDGQVERSSISPVKEQKYRSTKKGPDSGKSKIKKKPVGTDALLQTTTTNDGNAFAALDELEDEALAETTDGMSIIDQKWR